MGKWFQANRALAIVTSRRLGVLLGLVVVALLGILGGGSEAMASKVRYTLTATFSSDYAMNSWGAYCTKAVPPGFDPPRVDYVFACSADQADSRSASSYVARSVGAFDLKRRDFGVPHFEFKARMKGRFINVANGSAWSRTYIGGEGYMTCTSVHNGSARGPVTGTVSMKGLSPARVIVAVGSAARPFGRYTRDTNCDRTGRTVSTSSFGGLSRAKVWLKKSDLRKAFGHTFTLTDRRTTKGLTTNPQEVTTSRWTFRFTPARAKKPKRQRWQVDVRGTDQWRWGVLTGLRAGVDVDWRHRTTLEIEDDRIVSATGKVSIEKVRPYSEPLGVFTVTPTVKKTRPKYKLPRATKSKRSKRVTLMTYDRRLPSSSEYLLKYAIRLTGPQALDIIRQAGLPNHDVLYGRLVERERLEGPVIDSVAPFVPDPARLVFLLQEGHPQQRGSPWDEKRVPCPKALSDQSCFRYRGGQIVTVTKLR